MISSEYVTRNITYIANSHGLNQGGQEVDEDDEAHGKAAETAQFIKEDELGQVVDGGVDPSTTLRQQDIPLIRGDGVRVGVSDELGLVVPEVLKQQGCQVSIFTKMEQVLHMESVNAVLRVVVDDGLGDEEWLVGVGSAESVHSETTWQASDRAEQAFECFGEVVRDVVFVDLHHSDDRVLGIGDRSFTANTEDLFVMHHPGSR
jgi:hypothetical protein